jgi:hypothetical protein
MSSHRYFVLGSLALVLALTPSAALADDVLAGYDLFTSPAPNSYQSFEGSPIPADFFDPGSSQFSRSILLGGQPLGNHPSCPSDNLSAVDTIVRRLSTAVLPTDPSTDTIPIEIVALSLVSVNPITVFYDTGADPELWNVSVDLSALAPQPIGTMTISHTAPSGGTFDSILPVIPRFTFTRISDSAVRVLDLGCCAGVTQFAAFEVPWVYSTAPGGSCTSNFCVNPGQLTGYTGAGSLATHGVISVCPESPVSAPPSSWGTVKRMYQDSTR